MGYFYSFNVVRFLRLLAIVAGFVLCTGFCFLGFDDDIDPLDGLSMPKPISPSAENTDFFSSRLTFPVSLWSRNSELAIMLYEF